MLVEYLALEGRSAWILGTIPAYAGVALTTIDQDLLATTSECDGYCVLHLFLLMAYAAAELGGLWVRGYTLRALAPYGVAVVVLAIWYRTVLDTDGFDAADADTLQKLRIVGTLEILAFVVARALVGGVA